MDYQLAKNDKCTFIMDADGMVLVSTADPGKGWSERDICEMHKLLRAGADPHGLETIYAEARHWREGRRPDTLNSFEAGYIARALETGARAILKTNTEIFFYRSFDGSYIGQRVPFGQSKIFLIKTVLEQMIEVAPLSEWRIMAQ